MVAERGFDPRTSALCSTKREVLRNTATIFDPAGLLSAVTLNAKVFLQELWKSNIDWDMKLTPEQQAKWDQIREDLQLVNTVSVPRYIGGKEMQLHVFTDASMKAYAAVAYLRVKVDNTYKCNILFSKARVAPQKSLSIPRLELLAVLAGTRLIKFICSQIDGIQSKTLWTDAKCCLHWLKSTHKLPRFIENRLREIKSHDDITFRYVSTASNVSDFATRGLSIHEIKECHTWWHGPEWLSEPEDKWPICEIPPLSDSLLKAESEIKPDIMFETSAVAQESTSSDKHDKTAPFSIDAMRYSSLQKLLRVTAYCMRFIAKLKKISSEKGMLTANELSDARKLWEIHVQSSITLNHDNKAMKGLGLQLHQDGLLRCHGRLNNTELPEMTILPKILPRNSHYTQLVIRDTHNSLCHAGTSHTLSHLRREYWVPKGRSIVKSVIHKCMICRKWSTGAYRVPPMPSYPLERVKRCKAFQYCGLDYLGCLYVKNHGVTSKCYVALFVCMVIRGIHLELVPDLTTEGFLLALRKFCARRGVPHTIFLDNAPNFKQGSTVVGEIWKCFDDPEVHTYLASKGITWKFHPEYASHMAGHYERLVGLVKNALRRTIGRLTLTSDQLQAFLAETEATLNTRPLCYVGEGYDDQGHVICPSDFMSINTVTGIPDNLGEIHDTSDPDYLPSDKNMSNEKLKESWSKGLKLLSVMWNIFYENYLVSLRERYQNQIKQSKPTEKVTPSPGNVVLIGESPQPRGTWKLGLIVKLHQSQDGEIRSADVKTKSGKILTRPLTKLFPLESGQTSIPEAESQQEKSKSPENTDSNSRPKRRAAIVALKKISDCL